MDALGFAIDRFAIPADIVDDEAAGIAQGSYEGRYDIVAERGTGNRSLLINGHIDVVPADDATRWTSPPFEPTVRDGWMIGRGAGDMKGGFAAGLLAVRALDEVAPGWQRGTLRWVAAIEEESTGNGTLASGRAGHLADAALLLEPTDLEILLGGISLIWVGIELEGLAGHAEAAGESVNPILTALSVVEALRGFEAEMNRAHREGIDRDEAFGELAHPYNVNIGTFHAGDWASSVPPVARLQVRVGHPAAWTSEEALARVAAAVTAGTADVEWLVEHPPIIRMTGYRAERYLQDSTAPLVTAVADAHAEAHGARPALVTIGSTTDARFYLNQFGVPALAYGPRTRNMHGTDEAVELASIVECAKTVARFLQRWFDEGSGA
nr:M20/M25/M40 family metallo-hydrolase [Galbitalea soli]